jgi:outer membrane lipoprotein SlyB
MHMRKIAASTILAFSALGLSACATGMGANDYERGQIGQVSRVDEGVVLASRAIRIEANAPVVGGTAGTVVGGVLGSQVGGGDEERAAMGVIGAVVGGVAGAAIDRAGNARPGFAYTVRLQKTNEVVTITQGGDVPIANGTPVFIEYGARVRVIPQNASIAAR